MSHNQKLINVVERMKKAGTFGKYANKDIAEKTGYPHPTVSMYIRGIQPVSGNFLEKFSKAYGVSITDIEGGVDDRIGQQELPKSFQQPRNTGNIKFVPVYKQQQFLTQYQNPTFMETLESTTIPGVIGECLFFEQADNAMWNENEKSILKIRRMANEGDMPLCRNLGNDPSALIPGRSYVFQTTDRLLYRVFEKSDNTHVYLSAMNPNWKPGSEKVSKGDIVRLYWVHSVLPKYS